MARKVLLVILVSDQTIPNFLSIKTFTEANHYLFITTELMENEARGNRRKWIMKATGIEEDICDKITVNAEFKEDVLKKLSVFNKWEQFDEIVVNITGGTKMMSLACYEFFKTKTDKIWYLPINSNDYHLCDKSEIKRTIIYQTCVEEYLNCCGIHKDENRYSEKLPLLSEEYTNNFFKKFIANEIDKTILEKIRTLFRADEAVFKKQMNKKRKVSLAEIEDFKFINDFLILINFPSRESDVLFKDEMEYLTGGWFEEFTFHLLINIKDADSTLFKLGVGLNPSPKDKEKAKYFTHNDLDVVLVNKNIFYVIECKSDGMNDSDLFNKTIYLASALKKYFGLTVKSALFTLSEMNENQKEKAETLGIMAFDKTNFVDENRIQILKSKLKL